jgi:ribosome-binding protein aMBF1 (putative translation factor)
VNDTQRKTIGDQVAGARGLRGMTQRELAAQAGIAANTVRAIERGQVVQPGKLAKVMEALDIKPMAEAQEDEGYPADVELVRDAIGMTLLDIPEGERANYVRALFRAIMTIPRDGA